MRLEFPILSLDPGLRPRGVAPDVGAYAVLRMKALLLTLLHLTVMTAMLCGPGPAPFLTTLPSARGGERGPKNLLSRGWTHSVVGLRPPMPATGTTRGNLRGFGERGGRFGRGGGIARRGPAVGPDVGRGGCPETDANRGIIGP